MPPEVCVGTEFTIDDEGRLHIAIAGTPAEEAWPYDCSAADGNPLRFDPTLGLWIPPQADAAYHDGGLTEDTTVHDWLGVGGTRKQLFTADDTMTNPSDCLQMRVLIAVEVEVTANIAPLERVIPDFLFDPGDGTGFDGPNVMWSFPNPIASGDTQLWSNTTTQIRTLRLDPGEVRAFHYRVGATAGGFCTVSRIAFRPRMLGVTLA